MSTVVTIVRLITTLKGRTTRVVKRCADYAEAQRQYDAMSEADRRVHCIHVLERRATKTQRRLSYNFAAGGYTLPPKRRAA